MLTETNFTAAFCGWEGYRFDTIGSPTSDSGSVWIELVPDADRVLICSGCGGVAKGVHNTVQRWVRDLPAESIGQTQIALYPRGSET